MSQAGMRLVAVTISVSYTGPGGNSGRGLGATEDGATAPPAGRAPGTPAPPRRSRRHSRASPRPQAQDVVGWEVLEHVPNLPGCLATGTPYI